MDASGEEWRVVGTVGANVTSFTHDGLLAGKTYLYRVRAFNAAGASALLGDRLRPHARRGGRSGGAAPGIVARGAARSGSRGPTFPTRRVTRSSGGWTARPSRSGRSR